MQITATLIKSLPLDQREHNGKVYKKQPIEVITSGEYPDTFKLIFEERTFDTLKTLEKDKQYIFHINLRGRKWQKDAQNVYYFTDLICWKVEPVGAAKQPEVTVADLESGDDLPF